MNNNLTQNKKSWDTVAHHFNGKDALPSYGPFTQSEDELQLFGEIKDKKVLEIGIGSGHSLLYMAEKGASELWGVDLSQAQIETAKNTLRDYQPNLNCAPMEMDIGLPKEYFDYVYSIYAIGWTTDLDITFRLIYSYLKKGGSFIFSWDHPLYSHITSKGGTITLEGSYQEEGPATLENFKEDHVTMVLHKRKMATFLNGLLSAGFTIQTVIESDVPEDVKHIDPEISDRYYSLYKAKKFPTTMIIKAVKG
ncbi:class I SAM-dependent methyltransferase [Fredinandcohnia sp. 179-A 10B2 NHS]|uniref:class I SAM-dependent methyltransferase n=1 Tax=Fredinandcohnia sp. 179-A 10B2 NHS TaxID=3235176 RepID=UPI0039A34925